MPPGVTTGRRVPTPLPRHAAQTRTARLGGSKRAVPKPIRSAALSHWLARPSVRPIQRNGTKFPMTPCRPRKGSQTPAPPHRPGNLPNTAWRTTRLSIIGSRARAARHTPTAALARLTERHLADLRKSGLSDEQIERCGFHSLLAPASVQAVLRWKRYQGELGNCLAIPFRDAEGKAVVYARLKPDNPRQGQAKTKQADQVRMPQRFEQSRLLPARHAGRVERRDGPADYHGRRKESGQGRSRGVPVPRTGRRLWLAEKAPRTRTASRKASVN